LAKVIKDAAFLGMPFDDYTRGKTDVQREIIKGLCKEFDLVEDQFHAQIRALVTLAKRR
jgi:hypothetical protein